MDSRCTKLEIFFVTNKNSVEDPTTLWVAHKAFMQGLFIQMGATEKKMKKQRLDSLLVEIQNTDSLNKSLPPIDLKSKLIKLGLELRSLLLENFDQQQKRLKMHFYVSGNKPGKLLARYVQGRHTKTSIPFLYHCMTKYKIQYPQAIA